MANPTDFMSILNELLTLQRDYHNIAPKDESALLPVMITKSKKLAKKQAETKEEETQAPQKAKERTKDISPEALAEIRAKRLEDTRKKIDNNVATLKEKVRASQGEESVVLLESIVEDIQRREKIPGAKKVPARVAPPPLAEYRNKFEKEEYERISTAYFELLNYTLLAFKYDQNGVAENNALKLAVLFGDSASALDYLKNSKSIHDACLFTLPPIDKCEFMVWRAKAKKNMHEKKFRELLPFAPEIERLINEDVRRVTEDGRKKAKLNYKAIKAKEDEVSKTNIKAKKLKRISGAVKTSAQKREYQEVSKELIQLNEEYLELCAGVSLADANASLLIAYNKRVKSMSHRSFLYFRRHGLTEDNHEKFLNLNRKNAGKHIPNVFIAGTEWGYPGCYLKKINAQDEQEAAIAACGGKSTNCCQSLSGELGEPCVIHGLTSPDGGFYVVIRGDPSEPKENDDLLGLAWTWRSESDGLVFDSVERSEKHRTPEDEKRVSDFFRYLGFKLVTTPEYGVQKVTTGATSGISETVGLNQTSPQMPKDYNGYRDSKGQLQIALKNKPYLLIGKFYSPQINQKIYEETRDFISAFLKRDKPLKDISELKELISFAITRKDLALLPLIKEQLYPRKSELEALIAVNERFIQKLNQGEVDLELINEGADINVKGKNSETPLMHAVRKSDTNLMRELLAKGADLEVTNQHNETAARIALAEIRPVSSRDIILAWELRTKGTEFEPTAQHKKAAEKVALAEKRIEIVKILLEGREKNINEEFISAIQSGSIIAAETLFDFGADVNTKIDGAPAVVWTASKGKFSEMNLLLDHGAFIDSQDKEGNTPLIWFVKLFERDIVENLLSSGASVNIKDQKGCTALHHVVALDTTHTTVTGMKIRHDTKWQDKCLLITALLDKGADVNLQDNEGLTPLHHAVLREDPDLVSFLLNKGASVNLQDAKGLMPLHHAILKGDHALVDLLLKNGADVNLVNKTFLLEAIKAKTVRFVISILQENKINISLKDSEFGELLEAASKKTLESNDPYNVFFPVIGYLIDQACVQKRVNVRLSKEGDTFLMLASSMGWGSEVKKLLSHGADATLKTITGEHAIAMAETTSHTDISEIIKSHQATTQQKLTHRKLLFSKEEEKSSKAEQEQREVEKPEEMPDKRKPGHSL